MSYPAMNEADLWVRLHKMGMPDDENASLWEVTELLARDPRSRSSIAGALHAARENTRAVRHVVPVEMWERINATWSGLPGQWEAAQLAGPATYLAFVKTQTAAITGLADTTMSRDQTWHFFTLGRCLDAPTSLPDSWPLCDSARSPTAVS